MVEKQTQTITIDDVEHSLEDFTEQQHALLSHIADLDRKIRSTQFNLDQLNVGRNAFMGMLKSSLETAE
jgi:cell division septum initiation protein DivIVA